MRRALVVVSGSVVGVSLGVLLGACGGYFECDTFHHHITAGTYVQANSTFKLVIDDDRHVVVTEADGSGGELRSTYTMGAEHQTPVAQ